MSSCVRSEVERFGTIGWLLVTLVWLLGAFGSGAALALLYRTLHPELAYYKLWAFWTVVVSVLAGAIFAVRGF